MKLDNIKREINSSAKTEIKEVRSENTNKLNTVLNPLQGVDIKSDIYSFNELKSVKENFDNYMKSCENYIFYLLHQSFMCDEEHKKFFKSMVGRFYDLPERLWGYYRGIGYSRKLYGVNENDAYIYGLELLENYNIYLKFINGDYSFHKYRFNTIKENIPEYNSILFNDTAFFLYWDKSTIINCTRFFTCDRTSFDDRELINMTIYYKDYEYYSFNVSQSSRNKLLFIPDLSKLKDYNISKYELEGIRKNHSVIIADLGIENIDEFSDLFNKCIEFKNYDITKFEIPHNFSEQKMNEIRSFVISENWNKEYIINNYELFDLDILSLNMSVPWDIELVKFFISKGYGHRMAQNKAVFDKVFLQILNDNIIDKIFHLEYEYYTK